MIKNLLIFFAALLVLSGTFAGYLEWLLAQTEPGMAQKSVLSVFAATPGSAQVMVSDG